LTIKHGKVGGAGLKHIVEHFIKQGLTRQKQGLTRQKQGLTRQKQGLTRQKQGLTRKKQGVDTSKIEVACKIA